MITEDYVSFETAKLLKEKGFNENTEHEIWYVIKQFSTGCHWNSCTYKVGDITREYDGDCCISMPTLQMAMKWLREVHNITIGITFRLGIITYEIQKDEEVITAISAGRSYEDMVEEAIKLCLEKLI